MKKLIREINKAQMKIQQMAFMIVAVFFFFILVGLFFITWQYGGLKSNYAELEKEQTITSLSIISDMPELNCDSKASMCLDEDKLNLLSNGFEHYRELWPVASVKVYKIYPKAEIIKCPAANCNFYEIYNSQVQIKEYSTYVSICKKNKEQGYVYEDCSLGKVVAGVVIK